MAEKQVQEKSAKVPTVGDTVRYWLPVTGEPVSAQVIGVYNEGEYNATLRLTYLVEGSDIHHEAFAPFSPKQAGSWGWIEDSK